MAGTSHSFMAGRMVLYLIFWIISVVLLGLTSYRVHFTETISGQRHFYNPIIVELLVSAILGIIFVPFIVFLVAGEPDQYRDHMGRKRLSKRLGFEMLGLFILWVMWLVGAAYTTNRLLPGHNYCVNFLGIRGKQCNTVTSIVAFAWIGFGLLTILLILCLIHLQSAQALDTSNTTAAEAKERALAEPNTQQQGTTEPPVRMPTPNPAPAPAPTTNAV